MLGFGPCVRVRIRVGLCRRVGLGLCKQLNY